jgi:hypothetical protein
MGGHIVRYPLTAEEDYDLLLANLDSAFLDFDVDGFDALDRRTGDAGLPMLICGPAPAHLVMLRFAGYEQFYYHVSDFPGKVERAIRELDAVFRRDLWPAVRQSSARVVLHGAHFSSQMTPRPLFRQFLLPYFTDFNAMMHAQGKQVFWHADAEMGDLLDLVEEAGFDGADCLATAPLTPQGIQDYFSAWGGRITCWGGLPSTLFDPSCPFAEFERFLDDVVRATAGRNDFIFGASDNVLPGAEWERLRLLAERTGRRR